LNSTNLPAVESSVLTPVRKGTTIVKASVLSIIGRLRRHAAASIIAGLAIAVAVGATVSWGIATAGNDQLTGNSVTDAQLTAIVSAARSCPMLTPARLAGQLMTESGLDDNAKATTSGGAGIAGLKDQDWKQWSPWPHAERQDSAANVLALAHEMCDFSGQLRLAKTPGDQWRLALAAYRTGLTAVRNSGGVPGKAEDYVNKSSAYAAYYAKLPQFGGDGAAPLAQGTLGTPTDVKPLPDQLVAPVLAAGRVCQQVPPAAVAAVLMASSGFNSNQLGANGAQGVAQFLPELWQRYAPAGASAWDPAVAIPVTGTALCGLMGELSNLTGDPYMLALAAFRVGPMTVRQTNGTPDGATRAFLNSVSSYTAYYRLDTRLAAGPAPSSSPSKVPPSANPVKTTTPPAASPAAPMKPTTPPPTAPLPGKQFVQQDSGKCIDAGVATDGTHLKLLTCSSGTLSQRWDVRSDGTIRSYLNGACMDIAFANTADGTPIQSVACSGNPAQQWHWNGKNIYSTLDSNKCIDSLGDHPGDGTEVDIWWCINNGKQQWTLR
jgi:hypothetical protein